jgi:hypothetical protein
MQTQRTFESVEDVRASLARADYLCSQLIATVLFLAQATHKPVLIEGPAGMGKTELAKAVARCLNRELIRLQCYEGLDEAKALYDWEYAKQLLYTQMVKEKIGDAVAGARSIAEAVDRIAAQEDAFFRSGSSSRGRCCRRSALRSRSCCSSTRWTSPTRRPGSSGTAATVKCGCLRPSATRRGHART